MCGPTAFLTSPSQSGGRPVAESPRPQWYRVTDSILEARSRWETFGVGQSSQTLSRSDRAAGKQKQVMWEQKKNIWL
ncbi:hypothetical protein RRG08_051955 [Elysia crispata]|uniref:Uncharacterized protein n=1 Tax=Elysia crispata TaxID=231223 RepID=A0AAE0Y2F0_9GAST|nr:hypothetical protein RRG08_051955 [Elysia crispata]